MKGARKHYKYVGGYVSCSDCRKIFFTRGLRDTNFCSKECEKKFNQRSIIPILLGPKSLYDERRNEILTCEKCNNKYLKTKKYFGHCYLCIKGIRSLTHDLITFAI